MYLFHNIQALLRILNYRTLKTENYKIFNKIKIKRIHNEKKINDDLLFDSFIHYLYFVIWCLVFPNGSRSRLTNDPAYSYTSYNNAWCIAASGDTVHVVWRNYECGWKI